MRSLLCVQLASYLEGGPLMWMMPLDLHVNQKSDYDDMMRSTIRVSNSLDPIRPNILSGWILVQTICRSYQQKTLVGIEQHVKKARISVNAVYQIPRSSAFWFWG